LETNTEDWNMAKAYFMRLDEILTSCCISHMKGDILNYFKSLYRLYIEIEAKIPEKYIEETEILLKQAINEKNRGLDGETKVSLVPFVEFELQLRKILENKNMLTPKRDLKGL